MFHELHNRNSSSRKNQNAIQRYIELDNVGHCPNHEAPTVVGQVVSRWVNTVHRERDELRLLDDEVQLVPELWAEISAREIKEDDARLSRMDRIFTNMVS